MAPDVFHLEEINSWFDASEGGKLRYFILSGYHES